MLKSMTGYGRCEETVNGRHITAELKSVNHKYFEFSPRVTRGYGFLEDEAENLRAEPCGTRPRSIFI